MSAESWTLEEFEEYLEFAPPLVDLELKFLDSLDWRQLRRLANHYKITVRGDRATYLSAIKAKRARAIARRTEPTKQSPPADDISTSIASTLAEEEAQ
jgi:hypothetical protein